MLQKLGLAAKQWLLISCLCLGGVVPSSALGAQAHIFDAHLSLTGGCKTSKVDLEPDPGPCPLISEGGPGLPGIDHPSKQFGSPRAMATDSYGDIYVVDNGAGGEGANGRIDIFAPDGTFITEVPNSQGPRDLTVDSQGILYVYQFQAGSTGKKVVVYVPSTYHPATGEISYANPPINMCESGNGTVCEAALAINRLNDHLFLDKGVRIVEYKAWAEGGGVVDEHIAEAQLQENNTIGLAVDVAHKRIYVSDREAPQGGPTTPPFVIRVFNLDAPHEELQTIKGSAIPPGSLGADPSVAVEEASGDIFVYFQSSTNTNVYELPYTGSEIDESGDNVITIQHSFKYPFNGKIGIDNGPLSPNNGYLFVPSQESEAASHVFAFGPLEVCAPEIVESSFASVTETETELRAKVNPCNATTTYVFEYTTQQRFEEVGFDGAQLAGDGQLPAVKSPFPVSAAVAGLAPGTAYRFRILAKNGVPPVAEAQGTFSTYPAGEAVSPCPNDDLRAGLSSLLPDCRAYELVTPPRTNARTPLALGHYSGVWFASRQSAPDGNKVSFVVDGGTIPGYEGTGSLHGDPYLSSRGSNGWSTISSGPNGGEAAAPDPGSTSPDQGYSFWLASGDGSALVNGDETTYVRYPDGHSALIGRGSLADDPRARGKLISEGGDHIIFVSGPAGVQGASAIRLENDAPPSGTRTVYDRTSDEVTHVISLLPGNKVAGGDASYVAASLDGRGVAFLIGSKLYLRFNNEETYEIGENLTFAGLSEGGDRIFYLQGGNIRAFDVATKSTSTFASSGDAVPVNVSADGSTAYFISPSVLTNKANPNNVKAKAGKHNLYRSHEGAISFVGTVTDRDVEGETAPGPTQIDGLGLWVSAVGSGSQEVAGRIAFEPSRTTPDGSVFLFESRAPLTAYDSEGHAEIYRYDSVAETLACLSCNPTKAKASREASLQTVETGILTPAPSREYALLPNLRSDGRRALFQSEEPLVPTDTDGLQDVYEWEAQGVGSCARAGGCIYLISSGHSLAGRLNYLYSVSASGDDVFFTTSDLLVGADQEETYSIYDARVGGGFGEPPPNEPCEGEGCRPILSAPPSLASGRTAVLGKAENFSTRCPRGKRKVTRNGTVRCVRKKHHHKHHRAGTGKKGGRK